MKQKKVVLQRGKDKSLLRYHPWVFSGAILRQDEGITDGDIVEVYDFNQQYIGTGHYHNSTISVRIFSFTQIIPNEEFWKKKIEAAYSFREKIGLLDNQETNMFRLVHGEADGLGGLIIDWFDGNIVLQFHSYGMFLLKDVFVNVLRDIFQDKVKSIYNKSVSTLPEMKGMHFVDEFLYGNAEDILVKENGHAFYIDIIKGQKTGFFIDQRENRKIVENYAAGKRVLNLFCYTGGFSVYALAGKAKEVHSVDISKKAIEYTNRNIAMQNEPEAIHQVYVENVFDFLDKMPSDYYDMIILDPPAFAKHHKVKDQGIKGYRNINRKAMEKIKKGGFLFTFSCSQAISKDDFQTLLFSSAVMENKEVKIIKQLQQSADHPVSIFHPEGSYLKGFMLYIT